MLFSNKKGMQQSQLRAPDRMLPWQVGCKLSNQDVPEGDLAEFANTPTDFQACPTVGSSVEKTFSLAPYAMRQRLLNRPSLELRFAPRPIAKTTAASPSATSRKRHVYQSNVRRIPRLPSQYLQQMHHPRILALKRRVQFGFFKQNDVYAKSTFSNQLIPTSTIGNSVARRNRDET